MLHPKQQEIEVSTNIHRPHCRCLLVMPLRSIQHLQNQAVPNPVCHPAAGTNLGDFPPNGPAGMRGETTTDDPERHGASGVQPTEKGTRHPATH